MDAKGSAKRYIEDYKTHVKNVYNNLISLAPDRREEIDVDIERYRQGYLKRYSAWLGSLGNIVSPMISGRGNFNTRRHEKANASEHRKLEELINFKEKVGDKLRSKYNPNIIAPIMSSDSDALTKLKEKSDGLTSIKDELKRVNIYFRKHKSIDGLEVSDEVKKSIDRYGLPIPGFALTSINNKIKSANQRVERISKLKTRGNKEVMFGDVKVMEDTGDMRLKIYFPSIPDVQMRNKLKSHGWRWSRHNMAWQRKLTNDARYSLKLIFGGND